MGGALFFVAILSETSDDHIKLAWDHYSKQIICYCTVKIQRSFCEIFDGLRKEFLFGGGGAEDIGGITESSGPAKKIISAFI